MRRRLLCSTAIWGAAAIGAALTLQSGAALAACNVQPNPPGGDLTNQSNVTVVCDTAGGTETTEQGDEANSNVNFVVGGGATVNANTGTTINMGGSNVLTVNGTVNGSSILYNVRLVGTGNNVTVNSGGSIGGTSLFPLAFTNVSADVANNALTVNAGGQVTGYYGVGFTAQSGFSVRDNVVAINQGGSVSGTTSGLFISGDNVASNTFTVNGALSANSVCGCAQAIRLTAGIGGNITGNTITVGSTGSITSPQGFGVYFFSLGGTVSGNTINVNAGGQISVRDAALYFFGSAIGNTVTINGTVQATGTTSFGALFLQDITNNTITVGQGGMLRGTTAGLAFGLSGTRTGNVITNLGTISGATAISLDGAGIGDTNTIVNETTGIIAATGTNAIFTSGGALNVTNRGTINGNIVFDVGDDTLTLFAGQTLNGTVSFGAGNDRLVLDGSGSATFASTTTGGESLTKQGSGTWTLGSNQAFTGGTTVNGGSLLIGAGTTLTSNAMVNSGGILGGNGTLGGNLTLAGGTVSPGASIGTLTVTGNASLSNGTTLVELDRTSSDRLIVGGAATLTGGTVQAVFLETPQTGTYTFLNAGSIVGQFGTLIQPTSLFLTTSLSYTATTASLNVTRTSFGQATMFEDQQATAAAFDRAVAAGTVAGDAAAVFAAFDALPTFAAAANAFGQLGGEIHTSLPTTGVINAQQFTGAIRQHLRRDQVRGGGMASTASLASTSGTYANNTLTGNQLALANAGERIEPVQVALGDIDPELGRARGTAWMRGFGLLGSADGAADRASHDLGYRIAGVAGGADYAVSRAFTVGVALGYANTEADLLGTNADSARTDTVSGAIYGMWNQGPWFADASLGYAYDDYKTERRIIFGGLDRKAEAKYHGREIFLDAEAGYRFRWGGFRFDPSIGLAYTNSHQSSFDETGASSLNLSSDSRSIDSIRASIGARVAYGVKLDDGLVLVPEARLRYQRELGDEQRTLDARFAGINGGTFTVRGAEPGRDAALVGVGLTANLDPGLALFVDYDADIRSNAAAHAVTGGLRFTW